ncbi:MAG: glycosyltransferase family 4 protein [Candidatus Sedimenticola sp. 6PFRAG5]
MRILSVNKFFWRKGGSETVFFDEMSLLTDRGHTVVPFSMKNHQNNESEFSGYFVEEVDYEKGGLVNKLSNASKVIYSLDARNKMNALLKESQFDVAHFHIFQHQISPSVFGPLKRHDIPLVLTLHDLKPICPNYRMYVNGEICEECRGRKFYKCTLKRCNKGSLLNSAVNSIEMYLHYALGYYQGVDQYITVSNFYRNKMIEFGFPEDRVTCIPNMIDLNGYELAEDDDGFALYFGRLSGEKDLDTLLEAARRIPQQRFVIAGTGPDEARYRKFIERHTMENVEFVGYQTGESLRQLIRRSAFTLLPSKWYENCPMSVLESLGYARPVIGARIGGIPELIEDGVDGFHFSPGDAEDLAEKIRLMASLTASQRREMGMAGRERVQKHHAPDRHYDALISVYNSVSR